MSTSKIIAQILACITILSVLPACGANMKPDHPQVYESFKNRRPLKENQLLNTGSALDPADQRASQFVPYAGDVVENQNKSGLNADTNATDFRSATPATNPSNANDNENQKSFWERLKQKFSFNENKQDIVPRIQVAANYDATRQVIADLPQYIEQGGHSDYSYYDMAEPILSSEQISTIQLAANSSSPLVPVPEMESFDDLEKQSKSNKNPNLVEVPQPHKANDAYLESKKHTEVKDASKVSNAAIKKAPSSQNSQKNQSQKQDDSKQDANKQVHTPQIKPTSHNAQSHENASQASNIPQGSDVQDSKAKLVYQNGRYIVTGTMGSLKKEGNY